MKFEKAKKVAEIVSEIEHLDYTIDVLNTFLGVETLSISSNTNSVCIKGAMLHDIVSFAKGRFNEMKMRKASEMEGM